MYTNAQTTYKHISHHTQTIPQISRCAPQQRNKAKTTQTKHTPNAAMDPRTPSLRQRWELAEGSISCATVHMRAERSTRQTAPNATKCA